MAELTLVNLRDSSTETHPLGPTPIVLGSASDADLRVQHELVSRRHCEIAPHADGFVLRDLNSRNGTFLDDRRLPPGRPVVFRQDRRARIGDCVFSWKPDSGAQPRPPRAARGERRVVPVELKKNIHALLLERMDLKHTDMTNRTHEELRAHTTAVCQAIVREAAAPRLPAWLSPDALVKEVVDEAVGLGAIEDLLADAEVDEIMVCGWDRIYVERRGRIVLDDRQFTDNSQVVAIMRRILAPIGRRIDETNPMADGRLADGSRVNAIIPPLALSGPTLTIRKFAKTPFTVDDLVDRFRSLIRPMADFLALAVRHRANILISGGTGSGKTTLLNIASNYIPEDDRIVTIEDAAELQLAQEHVVRLESRPANLEGRNAVLIRDLVRNSLRMRPDRIVVGECRGGEALDMLQAMNTGHDGSLTTLHANSCRDALSRLETLVLMAGMDLPSRAIREQIASAIDFIVQISRLPDGSRKVVALSEVSGMEGDVIQLADIFRFDQTGCDADGQATGVHRATGLIPEFVHALRRRGVPVDLSLFREDDAAAEIMTH